MGVRVLKGGMLTTVLEEPAIRARASVCPVSWMCAPLKLQTCF